MLIRFAPLPLEKKGERNLAAVYLRKARRGLGMPRKRSIQAVRTTAAAMMRRSAREDWAHDGFAAEFLAATALVLDTAPHWANPVSFSEFEIREFATDGRLPK